MKRITTIAAGLVTVALGLSAAGCGNQIKATTTPAAPPAAPVAQTDTSGTSTPPTDTTSAAPLTGPVGKSFSDTDAQNNVMDVTLAQVVDPAQGANEFATPDAGKRFVAAKFKITGTTGTFSGDANNNATVIGSDGQNYTSDVNDVTGCTNFNYGEYNVSPGRSSVGCVVFQVPQSVKVANIQWGDGLGSTAPATWTVGR
jgi:hypothetical protein